MMTNNHDSKRKVMSEVIASSTEPPTKKTTKRSAYLALDQTTSMAHSTEDVKPPPLYSSHSATNVLVIKQQEQEQPSDDEESESEESDDNDSDYGDEKFNDLSPVLGQPGTNARGTQVDDSHDTDEIRKIRADIAKTEARMVEARDRVAEMNDAIKTVEADFMALTTNNDLGHSLADPLGRLPILFDYSSLSSQEHRAHHLRSLLQNLKLIRKSAAQWEQLGPMVLDSLGQQLLQALHRQRTVRPVAKRTVAKTAAVLHLKSGIFYLQDRRRIGMVGSSIDIGLVEMEDESVSLKDIIVVGDFSPVLEKAWTLCYIDISKKQFFKKLVKLVPSLSKTFVKNAWLALNMHYTADDDMRHPQQQYVYTPFTMLLMAAAIDGGSVTPSTEPSPVVYSSLSIANAQQGGVGVWDERKVAVMPTAAATLYRKWDAFGMMDIDRSAEFNDGRELIEYDRCVLITAITALAIKCCIKASDYDKVALPFIIWSGYNASLYVTRLDRQGNPVVSTVGYPSGDDGSVHDLSQSPCAARTKLFLAFAVLLHDFKSFFESSVKRSYNQTVQQRIRALENKWEYPYGPLCGW